MELSLQEILYATNGELIQGDRSARIARVCTDTRILRRGDLFVALTGPRFDGNAFLAQALEKGAAGAICTVVPESDLPKEGFLVRVHDGVEALGGLARARRRMIDPRVIGITGSTGKTTVKEMSAHLCRPDVSLLATEGNQNNHIGLPLTLCRLDSEHRVAILEMGMNHSGEIGALTEIAEPCVGVLTNIGDAHLGNFPNHDALITAKGELFAAMRPDGIAVLNSDCPNVAKLRERGAMPRQIVLYGESPEAEVRALNVRMAHPFGYELDIDCLGQREKAYVPLFGRFQIHNALAATTAALLLGIKPERIVERLATFQAPEMRSRVENLNGVQLIEDTYNASPAAMIAALESFARFEGPARRFALLGDMAELGDYAEPCHRRVGAAAAAAGLEGVICVGAQALWIACEATVHEANAWHVDSVDEAIEMLNDLLEEGDAILIKGSRVARLERAAEALRRTFGETVPGEVRV